MKKHSVLLAGLIFSTSLLASEGPALTILKRSEKSLRVFYTKEEMVDLESPNSFEGKYFRIVKGKNKEAISFDEKDEQLLLKAATVYYHLNKARDFWVNEMKSENAANLPRATVRIEIQNLFDELGHFANDARSPQFNNALTIPDGETPSWVPADKQDKWGKEIWFRPRKDILTKELPPIGPNPIQQGLAALEQPVLGFVQDQFNVTLMQHLFYPAYTTKPLYQSAIQLIGTYAMLKVAIYGSKYADPLFMDKWYYLDSALVPEIIAHEYSHMVLSDNLAMSHSTPVNEGLADYFAAVMSGKRKVYAKVAGHSNAAPKDTQNKRPYSHWDESNRTATGDFTLSVLFDVRETLGNEIGDKVVYQSRKYLKTESSTVSDGLLRAILKACDDKCEAPRRDKLKLYETFAKKGF